MTQSAQRPIRKPRRPRTWTAALLALTVPGCSDMEIDQRDELGLEGEGRSELVVIGEPPQEADDDAPASPYPSDPGPDKPVYFDPNGEFTVQIGLRTDRDKAAAAAAKWRLRSPLPRAAVKRRLRVRAYGPVTARWAAE